MLLSTILTSPGRASIWTGMEEHAMSSMRSWFPVMSKMLSITSPERMWTAAGGVGSGTWVRSLSWPCWLVLMVILNIGRIMVELSGGWCLTDYRRYWDRFLSWCSVPLRDSVLLLMKASLLLRGAVALCILSVPNGGGLSLHIEEGVPARVSWSWGGGTCCT